MGFGLTPMTHVGRFRYLTHLSLTDHHHRRLDDWLADFSMTESDLQIAAYPSLFPIIQHTGVIDPFLSAPHVDVVSAAGASSSVAGDAIKGSPSASGGAQQGANTTPALLHAFPPAQFLPGSIPAAYLPRAPHNPQPSSFMLPPPAADTRPQHQRAESQPNGTAAVAPHDARAGPPGGPYPPGVDPFAQPGGPGPAAHVCIYYLTLFSARAGLVLFRLPFFRHLRVCSSFFFASSPARHSLGCRYCPHGVR